MQDHAQRRGSAYILASAFLFATYGIWSRLMVDSFGVFSQAWTRGLLLLCVIMLINLRWRIFKPVARKDIFWFLLIACSAGLNQAPYFFGFQHLSIGTATLLFYAALVVGGYVIGSVVFGEVLTFVKWVSLGIAFVGMFAIYHFALTSDQILPAVLTLVAGVLGAMCAVLPKKLSMDYSELQILAGSFTVMFITNGILAALMHESLPHLDHHVAWFAQLGYASTMLAANWAVIEGFRHVEASIGSLIGLAEIVFGIIFGALLFGEPIGLGVIIGTILIAIAAVLPDVGRRWV